MVALRLELSERDATPMNASTLVDFLSDPQSYPHRPDAVELVETHISWVFLAGEFVYKVKKPVKFDFVDYSTLVAREKACQRELRLNRRLAPEAYLDVLPLYFADERWSFAGEGSPAEFAVHMRRLPDDRMLSRLLKEGGVSEDEIETLAATLAKFYQTATTGEKIARSGLANNVELNVRANFKTLRELCPEAPNLDRLENAQLEFLLCHDDLFETRVKQGKIRDGHGDLRAEHICMTSPPVVFDCIEFNDRFRHVDVIDDASFLYMDLEMLGAAELAKFFWSRLASKLSEDVATPLLDFYASYRATVRAKVEAIRAVQSGDRIPGGPPADRCVAYLFKAAEHASRYHQPHVLVTMGLMGCGKSTLAQALCNALGMQWFSSDEIRREMFGGASARPAFGKGIYSPENVDAVYQKMFQGAEETLRQGAGVVLDATFGRHAHREQAIELAAKTGFDVLFLECWLPKNDAIARLDHRFRKDRTAHSEGRPELYDDQRAAFESTDDLARDIHMSLDTRQPVPSLVQMVIDRLINVATD